VRQESGVLESFTAEKIVMFFKLYRNVFILDTRYLKIIQTYFTVDGNIVLEVLSSAKKSIEFIL